MLTMIDHRRAAGRFPWISASVSPTNVSFADSYRHVPIKKRPFKIFFRQKCSIELVLRSMARVSTLMARVETQRKISAGSSPVQRRWRATVTRHDDMTRLQLLGFHLQQ